MKMRNERMSRSPRYNGVTHVTYTRHPDDDPNPTGTYYPRPGKSAAEDADHKALSRMNVDVSNGAFISGSPGKMNVNRPEDHPHPEAHNVEKSLLKLMKQGMGESPEEAQKALNWRSRQDRPSRGTAPEGMAAQ